MVREDGNGDKTATTRNGADQNGNNVMAKNQNGDSVNTVDTCVFT